MKDTYISNYLDEVFPFQMELANMEKVNRDYVELVKNMEKLKDVKEKINYANSKKVSMFHDQKSDMHFSTPYPNQEIDNISELQIEKAELVEIIKEKADLLKKLVQDSKEKKDLENIKKGKGYINNHSDLLAKNFLGRDNSQERTKLLGSIVDKQLDLDIETYSSAVNLVNSIENDKIDLNTHIDTVKCIDEKESLLSCLLVYNMMVVDGKDKKSQELLQKDRLTLEKYYDLYSKNSDRNGTKEEFEKLVNPYSELFIPENSESVKRNRSRGYRLIDNTKKIAKNVKNIITGKGILSPSVENQFGKRENFFAYLQDWGMNKHRYYKAFKKEKSEFEKSLEENSKIEYKEVKRENDEKSKYNNAIMIKEDNSEEL